MRIRVATPDDFDAVLALNAESVAALSPLTGERLAELHAESALHWVVVQDGHIIAFLLAFREGARYDSVNYQWFAQRYPRFLYVDRVVVSRALQARGAGSLLYQAIFAQAREHDVPLVACEYDIEPLNAASARFHAKFGFREVGRQAVVGGKKRVSLQVADVVTPSP